MKSPLSPTSSDVLRFLEQNPDEIDQLDPIEFAILSERDETRAEFLRIVVKPILEQLEMPRDDIRISLESDGEGNIDEIHLHLEFLDHSPIVLVEAVELQRLSAGDILDKAGEKNLYGLLAKTLQTALQTDQIMPSESGRMNEQLELEEKKLILSEVIETLLEKAGQ